MPSVSWVGQIESAAAHPLSELLACPASIRSLLDSAATELRLESGAMVFRQNEPCRGLYLAVSGTLLRRAERNGTPLFLGTAHSGDLLELAATLSEGRHTYTLTAQSSASLLLLPAEILHRAFHEHPPLRMHLLEELAREVSRGYLNSGLPRIMRGRRRSYPALA